MVAHPELSLLLLLAIAALVAVLANRARLPYAVGLVLAGLVLGNLVHYSGPHLSKELLFAVVLPGLLFEAAYQMHFAEFWRARLSILTLAVPGLIVATVLTAAIAWWGINRIAPGSLLWIEALVFGALISATDPISVLGMYTCAKAIESRDDVRALAALKVDFSQGFGFSKPAPLADLARPADAQPKS